MPGPRRWTPFWRYPRRPVSWSGCRVTAPVAVRTWPPSTDRGVPHGCRLRYLREGPRLRQVGVALPSPDQPSLGSEHPDGARRRAVPAATRSASTSARPASRPARSRAADRRSDSPSTSTRSRAAASRSARRPSASSSSLARLNGRDPKNPRDADSGDGCTDSIVDAVARRQHRLQRRRVATPQHRHHRLRPGHQRADRALGDGLPALAPVRRRRARPHGQHPVEQHHPALRPRRQITGGRRGIARGPCRTP